MTDAQKRFVELEKKKKEMRQYFDDLEAAAKEVAQEVGIDGYFQDHEGTVYQIVRPEGTFVEFRQVGYKRTRRLDEKRGDLSLKAAKEAGFNLPE